MWSNLHPPPEYLRLTDVKYQFLKTQAEPALLVDFVLFLLLRVATAEPCNLNALKLTPQSS